MIPKQLQRYDFRFIQLKKDSKAPEDNVSWKKNLLSFDNVPDGKNVGIVCGYGGLTIVDCDNIKIAEIMEKKFPNSFRVKTASGKWHFYFIAKDVPKDAQGYYKLIKGSKDYGELRLRNCYCVCPPSQIGEGIYTVATPKDVITKVSYNEITKVLADYLPTTNKDTPNVVADQDDDVDVENLRLSKAIKGLITHEWSEPELQKLGYPSRSERDQAIVASLVRAGYEAKIQAIFEKYPCGDKYREKGSARSSYLKHSFLKAKRLANIEKKDKQEQLAEVEFDVVSADDLLQKNFDNQKWLIKDLIPNAGVGIYGSKRAEFKTFSSIHMAVCVAAGLPAFGEFETEKRGVLYIDEENGEELVQERLKMVMNGFGLKSCPSLFFLTLENFKADNSKHIDKLTGFIKEKSIGFVIFDSMLRCLATVKDENDSTQLNRVYSEYLKPTAKSLGVFLLFLHHLRKGQTGNSSGDAMDEFRGSSEVVNFADIVIKNTRPKGAADRFVLSQLKCRRSEEIPSKLVEISWGEDSMTMTCIGDALDSIQLDELCSQAIMQWLGEVQKTEFKTKDAHTKMKGKYSRACITRALKLLREKGSLLNPKRGEYRLADDKQTKLGEEKDDDS